MSRLADINRELAISEQDQRDVRDLYAKLQQSHAKLIGPDGKSQNLPPDVHRFLVALLTDLVAGKSVTILQKDALLTTVEAAAMLGVSRQFLVNLLESGEIPHHKVGTHRRIYVRDVLAYKARRDAKRSEHLNQMAKEAVESGYYDMLPLDDTPE